MDVTFNICIGKYQSYKKPNDTPTYIDVNSNDPPNIIKILPNNISKRISNISSNKATFNNAAPSYNDVLSASGYKENLTYQQDLTPSKKVRQRKIIWFNPPYSVNVETNIGKTFLKLIDKHFPKTNKFHKIFNRNNVKVSYSCLPNFANIIKSHNNRILSEEKTQDQPKCNCWQKDTCPLEGHCLDKELIYRCIPPVTESIASVLQKIHWKTDFISTAILSSTKVKQIPQNYLNISEKWKENASKNQSSIGQLLIMLNLIRTGSTYV